MAAASKILPITGFVLAGGRSKRMGADKAGLSFKGTPLVKLGLDKLSFFCAETAIAGNRTGLAGFGTVVTETRVDVGPGAGIEAGLKYSSRNWSLFVPVDVPLLPFELVRNWAADVLANESKGVMASYLVANKVRQPAICMLHKSCLISITRALNRGERRVKFLLNGIDMDFAAGSLAVKDAAAYAPYANPRPEDIDRWFLNANTPEQLAEAEKLFPVGENWI
jgi:molybdopterin-guanine dinucleotide biosynthesis protein A